MREIDWDKIKEIICDHEDRAYKGFNDEYWKQGEMRVVGVVADNIIEEIKMLFLYDTP